MAKKAKPTAHFPARLFAKVEDPDSEDFYLNTQADFGDFADGDQIAIYELREFKRVSVMKTLEAA